MAFEKSGGSISIYGSISWLIKNLVDLYLYLAPDPGNLGYKPDKMIQQNSSCCTYWSLSYLFFLIVIKKGRKTVKHYSC